MLYRQLKHWTACTQKMNDVYVFENRAHIWLAVTKVRQDSYGGFSFLWNMPITRDAMRQMRKAINWGWKPNLALTLS